MSSPIEKWIWIVVIAGIILLLVHPKSQAQTVIGALSNQSINNIKALQGEASR
jgi:hypothetical protein